jgi:sterol desaturase/sphingolipid hydroxylase (fatty acid hydroxylase superfamily)
LINAWSARTMQTVSLSDLFVAVWPTIFALDLSRYLIAASLLVAILAVFAGPLASRRIQSRRASRKDVRREIGFSLSTVVLFSLVGFSVYLGSRAGIFRVYGGEMPSGVRMMADFAAMVLLHDAYFYWAHRLMHTKWLFRRVHRLHHRSRTPTPWAAYAFAPPEAILEAGILPVTALLLPLHEVTVVLFVTHMIVRNVIGHAGVELFPSWWLRTPVLRWITTTTHHDLHHSHGGYNFGLYFTWWDRWLKTEHPEYASRFMAVTRSTCPLRVPAKEKSNE